MKRTILSLVLGLPLALPAMSQAMVAHPWQGRKVAYLGDSITDPNHAAADRKYWWWLQEWLGITPYVYGVSGRQWTDIPRQAGLLKEEHGDDFDAIMVFVGTNDFNKGVPLGEWYEEGEEDVMVAIGEPKHLERRLRRRPAMTDSTYRGRINVALDSLKRMFPTKQIVVLTPIHRSDFFANDTNWQPSESYRNRIGEYLSSYVQASMEASAVWAVPVIDLGALCGLFPLHEGHLQYFNKEGDLLHPNNLGHKRMARTLMYQLLALPCSFEQD